MPVFSAAALPPFGRATTLTPGSSRPSTIFAVPSVDPSSTTITSKRGYSDAASERTALSMPTASLYAGTTIETNGS
jgi:hypothetical protein